MLKIVFQSRILRHMSVKISRSIQLRRKPQEKHTVRNALQALLFERLMAAFHYVDYELVKSV